MGLRRASDHLRKQWDVVVLDEKTPIAVRLTSQHAQIKSPYIYSFEDLCHVWWFSLAQLLPSEESFQRLSPTQLC